MTFFPLVTVATYYDSSVLRQALDRQDLDVKK